MYPWSYVHRQQFPSILPRTRTVLFHKVPILAILGRHKSENVSRIRHETPLALTIPNKVRLSKSIRILPMHEGAAKVVCHQPGLVTLESHHKVVERYMTKMVNGIVDNVPNQFSHICLRNFSNHTVNVPKNTAIRLASPAPSSSFTLPPHKSSGEIHLQKGGRKGLRKKKTQPCS